MGSQLDCTMENAIKKDTGFAWIVLTASFMGHFFQYGIVWTVGYFYVIFLEHMNGSKAAVALIASLNTATYYCIGRYILYQLKYINSTSMSKNPCILFKLERHIYWSTVSVEIFYNTQIYTY